MRLPAGHGPVVVVGRPHSGTRLVAGLLRAGGVFLGADLTDPQLDAWSIHQQLVVPLMRLRLADPGRAHDERARAGLAAAWPHYTAGTTPCGAWGWKVCEAGFVMPQLQALLPDAVFLHVLRDGRDVVHHGGGYFQVTAPGSDPPGWRTEPGYREFSRLVTFGRGGVRRWRGVDLDDPLDVVRHRYELQMQAWVTAVDLARRDGAQLGERYQEMRYEDLCAAPGETARELFRALGLPWSAAAGEYLRRELVGGHVGRWRHRRLPAGEARDFAAAVALGADLLQDCGYGG
jgi:Sulfotransferase family